MDLILERSGVDPNAAAPALALIRLTQSTRALFQAMAMAPSVLRVLMILLLRRPLYLRLVPLVPCRPIHTHTTRLLRLGELRSSQTRLASSNRYALQTHVAGSH